VFLNARFRDLFNHFKLSAMEEFMPSHVKQYLTGQILSDHSIDKGSHLSGLRLRARQALPATINLPKHGTGERTLGENGWYISPATVTLNASDAGSGVKSTEYL
jgi:hypothetical protein